MLNTFGLDNGLWVDFVNIAMYLINKSPIVVLDGNIPKKVWCGKLVDYSHFCIFGCDAFSHVPK